MNFGDLSGKTVNKSGIGKKGREEKKENGGGDM